MKKLLYFSVLLTAVVLALYFAHTHLVLEYWGAPAAVAEIIPDNYTFLFFLYLVAYVVVWSTWRIAPLKGGFAFMGLSLLKMMVVVAYLWQPLQNFPNAQKQLVLHFMVPYLLLLFFEVFEVYRLLKAAQDQTSVED